MNRKNPPESSLLSSSSTPSSSSNNNKIEVVQIDGLVVMKLIKHCHSETDSSSSSASSGPGMAQGALLGLVSDTRRLEITHSFPFPNCLDDDEHFQLDMMRRLRMVNVDHLHVGWYQSSQFVSPQLLESHFAYQTSVEESVCLIFDMTTTKGFLSLKAFRLTPQTIQLYKSGDFTPESIRSLKVTHDSLFQQVPIVIKNSHLVNELLLELSETIPVETGTQYLDLGSASVLENQLKFLMDNVDELNQEAIKFNKYQNLALKQCQDKIRWVTKRQAENTAKAAQKEDPLPDEDINKLFKPIPPPSRLNGLILSAQILSTSQQVSQFASQSLGKLFIAEGLQNLRN